MSDVWQLCVCVCVCLTNADEIVAWISTSVAWICDQGKHVNFLTVRESIFKIKCV